MLIIGIDLGTSNSAAAALRGGRPVIIPSAEGITLGGKAFPSYVAVMRDGQVLVGEPARRQAVTNPEGTATAFKRRMGLRDKIRLRDKEFSPEQLSAFLLQKIKRDAEAFLGEPVEKAVVTVPAYFDDNQRSATKDACGIAGTQLGGTDMNLAVFDHLADRFKEDTGFDVRTDLTAKARLIEAAELAKIELSTSTTTRINLPFLVVAGGQPRHLDCELTRASLERLVRPVVERCRGPVEQALHDASIQPRDIEKIVFVGGPTRMPVVRGFFEEIFQRKAEIGVDPMECVACGAAIQAGVLTGEVGDIVLVDVTPLTLGVETLGGVATPLIARNTPIPVKRSETFTTAADMQTSVTIHVYQGERPMAADNVSLGEFNLDGIPPAPRNVPKIDVTFDIDANGILNVAAQDLATGRSQSIRIAGSTRLPREEKERMVQEAERYAEQDKKRREEAEKLNDADSICYQAEKTLADYGSNIAEDLRKRIDSALLETRDAVKKRDAALAAERAEKLKTMLQEVGKKLYEEAAPKGPRPPPDVGAKSGEARPSGSGPRGRVVEAEFKETK